MILYVNGDSHAAAAEAVVPHAWAQDDGMFWGLGKRPHPDNERVSFGCEVANRLNAILQCDAQAGGSNQRTIRTTNQWLLNQENVKDLFLIIQWSTWEREEWVDNNDWVQVNASGIDEVPEYLQTRYKEFIANIDWKQCTEQAHEQIWQFHCLLNAQGIRHVMFNGNNHFGDIQHHYDWGDCYMDPYNSAGTYNSVLREKGFETVNPKSWHFGADAHCFWAEYVLHYIINHNLLDPNEIPAY